MQVYAQKGQFMHKAEINVTVMHKLTSLFTKNSFFE